MDSSIFFNHSSRLSGSFLQTHASYSPGKPSPILILNSLHSPTEFQTSNSKFMIQGGNKLSGHVNISGSKNSALAILAATLCCSGTSKLHNIPNVLDIQSMISVLRSLGVGVEMCNDEVTVDSVGITSTEPCAEQVGRIRAGFFVAGPLLARFGEAVVALPGGCDIGARPVDLFVRGFHALGATVELRQQKLYARVENGRCLVGGKFHFDFPSVGATETLMMAASMGEGVTVLSNVAREPEVVDLAQFLTDSGASVEGAGTGTLVINGRKKLHGTEFTIIPDRIEAGTFMTAAAITGSSLSMSPVIPSHLSTVIDKLFTAGCEIIQRPHNTLEIVAAPSKSVGQLQGFNIKTGPFPQFPTDLQPQAMVLLTMCRDQSTVEELIFEGRMGHVKELQKLGARIRVSGNTALVYGKEGGCLHGSHVVANDLRSGAALVLAGLAAEGITEIEGITQIDRGYEQLEMKLGCIGANIVRTSRSLATIS